MSDIDLSDIYILLQDLNARHFGGEVHSIRLYSDNSGYVLRGEKELFQFANDFQLREKINLINSLLSDYTKAREFPVDPRS